MLAQSVLAIDRERVAGEIQSALARQLKDTLRRRGFVVGLSGGIDSAVVASLCVRAVGKERVLGLLMPDRDSSADSLALGRRMAESLSIECRIEPIDAILVAAGCFQRQREAICSVFPDYGDGWTCKVTLPPLTDGDRFNVFRLTVRPPDGAERSSRLSAAAYLQLVAATNFKQRVRKMLEYYHADRTRYAVAGTPNRLEYDQGFFVKQGDGAADVKPIVHLYKTQVYALAEYLGVPEPIRTRPPTTDTFSMPQTQEEFYFGVPYPVMDLCLYAYNRGIPAAEVATTVSLTPEQVQRVFRDIAAKRAATRYQHLPPLFVQPVSEVEV